MLPLAIIALAVLCVPLTGGRLRELGHPHFRHSWLIAGALALQLASFLAAPELGDVAVGALRIAAHAIAAAFILANLSISGVWMIGLGGALNLLAVAANHGLRPTTQDALTAAGISPANEGFTTSATGVAHLGFLGDVFAVPASWPLHGVFSVGDVLIAVGASLAILRICRSRLIPGRGGQLLALREHRDFMRLWSAQAISSMGDWMYGLAVVTSLAERRISPAAFATLIVVQAGPAAVAGVLGGPLIDRLPRRRVMIAADVVSTVAVGSLLIVSPSLAHFYAVAACLGLTGALFQPAMQASVPNLVPAERVVAANALVNGTFHMSIMVGPVIGGVIAAKFGATAVFTLNALSFLVSALIVTTVRLPRQRLASVATSSRDALVEGLRYMAASPLTRAVAAVTGVVLFASALRAPLEPRFVQDSLGGGSEALGLVVGMWGLGMLLGSVLAPALARRHAREHLLGFSVALVGGAVIIGSQVLGVGALLPLWLIGGAGNAIGTVAYESLMQERTPDAVRGRVLSAMEALLAAAFMGGALTAGWLAGHLGFRGTFALSGLLFLGAAGLSWTMLGKPTRSARAAAPEAVEPAGPVKPFRPARPARPAGIPAPSTHAGQAVNGWAPHPAESGVRVRPASPSSLGWPSVIAVSAVPAIVAARAMRRRRGSRAF